MYRSSWFSPEVEQARLKGKDLAEWGEKLRVEDGDTSGGRKLRGRILFPEFIQRCQQGW